VRGECSGAGATGVYGLASAADGTGVSGVHQAQGIGVSGQSESGVGGAFQGGLAPLRIMPGPLAATGLTATGHQAGEVYMTSDHLLSFFDGSHWRQVLLSPLPGTTTTVGPPPTRGTPPPVSGPASAGTQGETVPAGVQPVPPARP
jgi:hypothetical protein